jgi:hypothetical protein
VDTDKRYEPVRAELEISKLLNIPALSDKGSSLIGPR